MSESPQSTFAQVPSTNNLAIISLVAGLVSWFLLPVVAAVVAIISGHMARGEIKRSGGAQAGDALAVVGLTLGYLNLVASCVLPILAVAGVISIGGICSLCAAISDPASFGALAPNP